MNTQTQRLAVVTGASSGIGFELAKLCAENGFDLVIAADEPEKLREAATMFRGMGRDVQAVEVDLATTEGVDELLACVAGRKVDVLCANAGHGLGRAFVEQDWNDVRHVIDTNVTGTVYLIQNIARTMRDRGEGRILVTGSIAGMMPGSYQAVYNGSKAFIDSFAYALRNELQDTGVTVTCLMPGATETEFFERADLMDTKVGTDKKMSAQEVAKDGFDAMMNGRADVVSGWQNKLRAAMGRLLPKTAVAKVHEGMAKPGTAKH